MANYWSSFGANVPVMKFAEAFDKVLAKLDEPETCLALVRSHPGLTSDETWTKLLVDALDGPLLHLCPEVQLDRIVGTALLLCVCASNDEEAIRHKLRELIVWLHGGSPAKPNPVGCYWELWRLTTERVWALSRHVWTWGVDVQRPKQESLRLDLGGKEQSREGMDMGLLAPSANKTATTRKKLAFSILVEHGVDVTAAPWYPSLVRQGHLLRLQKRLQELDGEVVDLSGSGGVGLD